jgi:TatD DNase family protein
MLIDTHCHVNFASFKDDSKEVIKRSLEKNIWLINVGSQLSTSKRAVEIAQQYERGVYAVVGLHPIHLYEMHIDESEQDLDFVSRAEEFSEEAYEKLLQNSKTVGIGEMGIDYFHMPEGEDPAEVKLKQRETFSQGINLARRYNKPIVIHTRPSKGTFDAYDDEIEILQAENYFKGVIHCFGGTLEQAKKFLDMGLLLSFTGIVTFKNAEEVREVVKHVPLEKMMVETDAPYLTPEPYRGKRNEPAYVEYVARKIAEIKGVSYNKVAEVTTNTAKNFFNIND